MKAVSEVDIQAPAKAVWKVVTDIENAPQTIQAIARVEVLERPRSGLVGRKWEETRTMFGKEATETTWITTASEPSHYETRAESHGSVYTTRLLLQERPGGTRLRMEFQGTPMTFRAKLLWGLMGWMFKGATRKALQKDLEDIKRKLESAGRPSGR